jgi:neutral ceramidase
VSTLYAGAGRALITPPLGLKTMGFASRIGLIERVESDLSATALVLGDGTTKVVLIAIDLCMSPMHVVAELRRRVAEATGTRPSHVMLNYNHTHSAPAFPGWLPEPAEQDARLRTYQDVMMARVVEAAAQANDRLQPARIAAGFGQSQIGVQRRERRADGFVFLGEVPDGEMDPAVGVLRVDALDGQPIALTCSYGCHTGVVGPRDLSASPDFPGAARESMEKLLGGTALFLQACGGDIMPAGGMGYECDCRDAKHRTGIMLGSEAAKVAAGLRTHVQRGERTSLGSVSTITLWPWVPVAGESCSYLGALSETLALDFMDYPPLPDAEGLLDEQRRRLDAAYRSEDARQIATGIRWVDWGEKLVEALKSGRRTLEMNIQVIRVNEIVIAGLSVEAFAGTGMSIKSRSPFAHTQVLGYTNGCVCYLPREQDFPPGGWDIHARYGVPDMLFQSYSLPTAIRPDSERRVVEKTLELIRQLR